MHCIGACFQAAWKGTPLDRFKGKRGSQSYAWIYKLRRVARWRGLTWEYFRDLESDDQAAYVAEYDIEHGFEYQEALDRLRKQRRASRR